MANVVAKGIDVSSHQGIVDFQKVKNAGYSYVIIKAGQGLVERETFRSRYLPSVLAVGLDWGAYWWSDAVSVAEAKQEANAFVKSLAGLKPTYPVYMDQEYASPCGRWGPTKNKQLRTDMVKAFLDVLQDKGYYAGLYSSTNWLEQYVFDEQLTAYDKWVAQYASKCTYKGNYGMWQHHGDYPGFIGRADGVSTAVDLNDCYRDYPSIIKDNLLNGWTHMDKTDKPIPETPDAENPTSESTSFEHAAQILKSAGYKSIVL